MTRIENLMKIVVDFRNRRRWRRDNTAKGMAIALLTEASELLEIFQWEKGNDIPKGKKKLFEEELVDIFYWLLLIAHDFEVDLESVLLKKMEKNKKKYPLTDEKGR